MGKSKELIDGLNVKLSRRGFVKSVAAVGAATALYGCSKDDGGEIIYGGGGIPL